MPHRAEYSVGEWTVGEAHEASLVTTDELTQNLQQINARHFGLRGRPPPPRCSSGRSNLISVHLEEGALHQVMSGAQFGEGSRIECLVACPLAFQLADAEEILKSRDIHSIAAVFVISVITSGCGCEGHPWEGLIYPKTGSMPFDLAIGHFETLEQCRAAAKAILSKMRPEPGATADYECGRGCVVSKVTPPPGQLALRTYKETAR